MKYLFSSGFFFLSRESICHAINPFWYKFTSRLLNWDDGLQALSQSGKGKEAAGREKKLAYLPFVEVMDNLTAQTFLTLPLWLRWVMQELSQRSVLPLKQLTVQKQSECSLCRKGNYGTLNQWQQINTANTERSQTCFWYGLWFLIYSLWKKSQLLEDH